MKWLVGTAGTGGDGTGKYLEEPLNFLELDDTYYRSASAANALSLARRGAKIHTAAPHLHVANKMSRDLRGLEPARLRESLKFEVLPLLKTLKRRYVGLVAQLSPSFSNTPKNKERLRILGHEFHKLLGPQVAAAIYVTFRHPSWYSAWKSQEALRDFEREAGIVVASWLRPKSWLPEGEESTSLLPPVETPCGFLWPPPTSESSGRKTFYVRLHGTSGKYRGWYDPKLLYQTLASTGSSRQHGTCILAFNNTFWGKHAAKPCVELKRRDGCALCNARRFLKYVQVTILSAAFARAKHQ